MVPNLNDVIWANNGCATIRVRACSKATEVGGVGDVVDGLLIGRIFDHPVLQTARCGRQGKEINHLWDNINTHAAIRGRDSELPTDGNVERLGLRRTLCISLRNRFYWGQNRRRLSTDRGRSNRLDRKLRLGRFRTRNTRLFGLLTTASNVSLTLLDEIAEYRRSFGFVLSVCHP